MIGLWIGVFFSAALALLLLLSFLPLSPLSPFMLVLVCPHVALDRRSAATALTLLMLASLLPLSPFVCLHCALSLLLWRWIRALLPLPCRWLCLSPFMIVSLYLPSLRLSARLSLSDSESALWCRCPIAALACFPSCLSPFFHLRDSA